MTKNNNDKQSTNLVTGSDHSPRTNCEISGHDYKSVTTSVRDETEKGGWFTKTVEVCTRCGHQK